MGYWKYLFVWEEDARIIIPPTDEKIGVNMVEIPMTQEEKSDRRELMGFIDGVFFAWAHLNGHCDERMMKSILCDRVYFSYADVPHGNDGFESPILSIEKLVAGLKDDHYELMLDLIELLNGYDTWDKRFYTVDVM